MVSVKPVHLLMEYAAIDDESGVHGQRHHLLRAIPQDGDFEPECKDNLDAHNAEDQLGEKPNGERVVEHQSVRVKADEEKKSSWKNAPQKARELAGESTENRDGDRESACVRFDLVDLDREITIPRSSLTYLGDRCWQVQIGNNESMFGQYIQDSRSSPPKSDRLPSNYVEGKGRASNQDSTLQRQSLPRIEERLSTDKEVVEKRRIRLQKRVEHERVNVEDVLRSQHVDIQHRQVERVLAEDETPQVEQRAPDRWVIPIIEERVVTRKVRVLREEIHLHSRWDQQRIDDVVELRREHIDIDVLECDCE